MSLPTTPLTTEKQIFAQFGVERLPEVLVETGAFLSGGSVLAMWQGKEKLEDDQDIDIWFSIPKYDETGLSEIVPNIRKMISYLKDECGYSQVREVEEKRFEAFIKENNLRKTIVAITLKKHVEGFPPKKIQVVVTRTKNYNDFVVSCALNVNKFVYLGDKGVITEGIFTSQELEEFRNGKMRCNDIFRKEVYEREIKDPRILEHVRTSMDRRIKKYEKRGFTLTED